LTRDSIPKPRHSGARLFGANPESITTNGAFGAGVAGTVVMDSGPARKRAHPGMTRQWIAPARGGTGTGTRRFSYPAATPNSI
jgi:hypothetical protein